MIEVYIIPKDIIIIFKNYLEFSFTNLNKMIYAEILLSYLYCAIFFTVKTDDSNEQLGGVISQNETTNFFLKYTRQTPI